MSKIKVSDKLVPSGCRKDLFRASSPDSGGLLAIIGGLWC